MATSSFFSASILIAIGLFVVREILAEIRDYRSKKRKGQALKAALRAELQRNFDAFQGSASALISAFEYMSDNHGNSFVIRTRASGKVDYRVADNNNILVSGGRIRLVDRTMSQRLYLDLYEFAQSQITWFERYQKTLDDLHHIQNGLFDYTEEGTDDQIIFFDGFVDWALNQLPAIKSELMGLHTAIADGEEPDYVLVDIPQRMLTSD